MTSPDSIKHTAEAEWIEHDGKGMPVARNVIVSIRTRDGQETPAHWNTTASDWAWKWIDERSGSAVRSGDILAYRIHQPATAKEGQ